MVFSSRFFIGGYGNLGSDGEMHVVDKNRTPLQEDNRNESDGCEFSSGNNSRLPWLISPLSDVNKTHHA
jgi:hypothetical protein